METIREIVRDAPFGQLVRYATRNRIFRYPEELPGFEIPSAYTEKDSNISASPNHLHSNNSAAPTTTGQPISSQNPTEITPDDLENLPSRTAELEKTSPRDSDSTSTGPSTTPPSHPLTFSPSRLEAEVSLALNPTQSVSHAIMPVKTADGLILAEWYTTTDTANPQNWSRGKKTWTAFLICLYTFIVYAGSSIYVSSALLVMSRFGVGAFKASLGLALYVLGK
jgi:DHA1 family multidrug resistance protein-like MFS transporter